MTLMPGEIAMDEFCGGGGVSLGIEEKTRARFWAKVDRRGDDECWPWIGALCSGGYGNFWALRRFMRATHVSLLIAGVEVPAGAVACHRCDNPPCVNPAHLFLGTRSENMQDCRAKGRSGSGLLRAETTRGESNVKAKLTEGDVRAIVDAWNAGGVSVADLARRFNVWPGTVGHIVYGRTWRHLGLTIVDRKVAC